jgi:cysteine synthase
MIARGAIKPGDRLADSTSGSMGTALGYCAKRRGIDAIMVVADSIPEGKLLPLRRYGITVATESDVVKLLGLSSSPGITVLTEQFCKAFGYVYTNQYGNPLNPESYERLLAPGLWEGVRGQASALIAAVGTGGTIVGLGRYFKRQNPNLKVISTFPYLGQSMGGARDKMRQAESKQPIADIIDVEEPIDYRVVKAVMSDLSEKGIHGGETTGAVIGAIDHYLLQEAAMGRLDAMRTPDGSITVITVFPDTEWPY